MGNPPSSLGLFQCSVHPSLCTSVTSSGPTGGPGLSNKIEKTGFI